MRTGALVGVLALLSLWPLSALAKPVAEIRGGSVLFYNDSLSIVVRNGVTAQLSNGLRISAATAHVDLRADRAVFAGNAEIVRGTATLRADALALDFPGKKIDVLRNDSGISVTDRSLATLQPAPGDGAAFAF
ncbi:MAG TPA: LptA/OstA family protein, partial [Candidatus Acidoferrum sp.]|nr:LptA/OstA family protein [Candidatus Acidoferrum sp.]